MWRRKSSTKRTIAKVAKASGESREPTAKEMLAALSPQPAVTLSTPPNTIYVALSDGTPTPLLYQQAPSYQSFWAGPKGPIPEPFTTHSPDTESVVTDTPLTGWRGWLVNTLERPLRLRSSYMRDVVWMPRQTMIGECKCDHLTTSGLDHWCGIYACTDRAKVTRGIDAYRPMIPPGYDPYGINSISVPRPDPEWVTAIGQVHLWGKVAEFSGGWRAEFAYPKNLVGDSEIIQELCDVYGIPQYKEET